MIHLATVHWKTDKWIDIQLKYIKKFIIVPYKLYSFLDSTIARHKGKYDFCCVTDIRDHGTKLDILADIMLFNAQDENDIIIFIDGDAFPVAELSEYLQERFLQYPLLAIQREEDAGDVIPHAAFCATTAGFWKKIKGTWAKGYRYYLKTGLLVDDPGGYLYNYFLENNIKWYALKRTNKKNLHPLFFGIYDNIIYHHGAGFRLPASTVELYHNNAFRGVYKILSAVHRRLFCAFNDNIKNFFDPLNWKKKKIAKKNRKIEYSMYERIKENENFYRELI